MYALSVTIVYRKKMENLNTSDDSDFERNSEKAVRRRRSSIIQSRTVIFDKYEENKSIDNALDVENHVSNTLEPEPFDLSEYISTLKSERRQWIDTLKQRKSQRRILAKQKSRLAGDGQPLDLSVLTEAERAFTAARPNYHNVCTNYNNLTDLAAKVSILHNIVYKRNQRFIGQMERRLQKAMKNIIEASGS